jgi:uncharacterized protein (TIGR02217 family)
MFHEIRLPETFEYTGSFGPLWTTLMAQSPGGYRATASPAPVARGRYTLSLRNRTAAESMALLAFFNAVGKGKAHGFRLHDLNPGEDSGVNEPLGVGNGAQVAFQLIKRYMLGSFIYDRPITKPVAVTAVYVDGIPTLAYTVALSTGILTLTSPPGAGVIVAASFTFDVPVRFDVDALKMTAVEPGIYVWDNVPLIALLESI